MAEGGSELGYDDPELDKQLDHDDDDEEEEVDRTRPFQPGAAFTPCRGGEKCKRGNMRRPGCHLAPKLLIKRRRTPRPCWEEEK